MGDNSQDHLPLPSHNHSRGSTSLNSSGSSTPSYLIYNIPDVPEQQGGYILGSSIFVQDEASAQPYYNIPQYTETSSNPIYMSVLNPNARGDIGSISSQISPSESMIGPSVNITRSPFDQNSAPLLINYNQGQHNNPEVSSGYFYSPSRISRTPPMGSMSYENDHKRQVRLAKNRYATPFNVREAAKESRRKKKDYIKSLEARVKALEDQNNQLILELKLLRKNSENKP